MAKTTFFSPKCTRVTLFLLLSGLFVPPAGSQQLDDVMVSAFAEAQSTGGGTLCWTLGEPMVEFYANGAALDQGFLQGFCKVTDVADPTTDAHSANLVRIFPNPTAAILNIQTAFAATYCAELSDMQGRLLKRHTCVDEVTELDLSDCPTGAYLLRIVSEGKTVKTSIIQKIR